MKKGQSVDNVNCGPGQIINPKTGRVVKIDGKIGRSIINQTGGNITSQQICAMESTRDQFSRLLYTHNTSIATLYKIVTGKENHIRCCYPDGTPSGLGAQFRHGLDSQYGDVIFVMKPNFFLNKTGFMIHNTAVTERTKNPVFGHIMTNDFLEYTPENQTTISLWQLTEAKMSNFRPTSAGFNGSECQQKSWPMSWCNIQVHLSENIGLHNVLKVYVPNWLKYQSLKWLYTPFKEHLASENVDLEILIKLINNNLRTLPNGKKNHLNGLFHFYGPNDCENQYLHYYSIKKNLLEDPISKTIYSQIYYQMQHNKPQNIQTARISKSSTSTIFLSELAFIDLQKKYFLDLITNAFHTPIHLLIERMDPMKGFFKQLLFTHNTPLTTLYKMITGQQTYIRCCEEDGTLVGLGAQFRYGLDSQYGDVIILMKPNFFLNKKGALPPQPAQKTNLPVFGHIFRNDFIEAIPDNQQTIKEWVNTEAQMYDFRPPSQNLDGTECTMDTWPVSWCNTQLHLGENIELSYIDKIYVPKWLKIHADAFSRTNFQTIQPDVLISLVNNSLPVLPNGKNNPLDGKFYFYGPDYPQQHYHSFTPNIIKDPMSQEIYQNIIKNMPKDDRQVIQTRRAAKLGTTSAMFLSQMAFIDLQKLYMFDLVRYNYYDANKVTGF